jgi:hypothetical protein
MMKTVMLNSLMQSGQGLGLGSFMFPWVEVNN